MEKQKRYTVTIDLYVYASTDDEAIKEAKKVIDTLENKDDCKAEILSIFETPFGVIGEAREIKQGELIKFSAESLFDANIVIGIPYHSDGNWYMLVDDFNKTDEVGTGSYPIKYNTLKVL